jgi:hypothetical protein
MKVLIQGHQYKQQPSTNKLFKIQITIDSKLSLNSLASHSTCPLNDKKPPRKYEMWVYETLCSILLILHNMHWFGIPIYAMFRCIFVIDQA